MRINRFNLITDYPDYYLLMNESTLCKEGQLSVSADKIVPYQYSFEPRFWTYGCFPIVGHLPKHDNVPPLENIPLLCNLPKTDTFKRDSLIEQAMATIQSAMRNNKPETIKEALTYLYDEAGKDTNNSNEVPLAFQPSFETDKFSQTFRMSKNSQGIPVIKGKWILNFNNPLLKPY